MPLYLYQLAYTADALAAQMRDPKDRIEVVRPTLEAAGGKLIAGGYPLGEWDAMVLYEASDDTAAAALALAFGSGGAVRSAKTTKLLSGQEWIGSLQKAQQLSSGYRPPR